MNFVADESVDRQIVEQLREDGHLVIYVSIQIFIQLLSIFPKNNLIDRLDEAFVDRSAREDIRKLIHQQDVRILSLNN